MDVFAIPRARIGVVFCKKTLEGTIDLERLTQFYDEALSRLLPFGDTGIDFASRTFQQARCICLVTIRNATRGALTFTAVTVLVIRRRSSTSSENIAD